MVVSVCGNDDDVEHDGDRRWTIITCLPSPREIAFCRTWLICETRADYLSNHRETGIYGCFTRHKNANIWSIINIAVDRLNSTTCCQPACLLDSICVGGCCEHIGCASKWDCVNRNGDKAWMKFQLMWRQLKYSYMKTKTKMCEEKGTAVCVSATSVCDTNMMN